jgi:hypothetical protein
VVSAARKHVSGLDRTYYPVSDKIGESSLLVFIRQLLRPLLANVLAERGAKAFVGANQFIYYEQYAPTESVAPDVYVMPGYGQSIEVDCWKTWETGVAPSFALEIVSPNQTKDRERSPLRHDTLGTEELMVFDPKPDEGRDRIRWTVYRRLPKRGLVWIEAMNEDRVYSKSLRLWLRAVGAGAATRIRVAKGPKGDELYPTPDERAAGTEAEIALLRAEVERLRNR